MRSHITHPSAKPAQLTTSECGALPSDLVVGLCRSSNRHSVVRPLPGLSPALQCRAASAADASFGCAGLTCRLEHLVTSLDRCCEGGALLMLLLYGGCQQQNELASGGQLVSELGMVVR